jgi:hypothetical protein
MDFAGVLKIYLRCYKKINTILFKKGPSLCNCERSPKKSRPADH